MYLTTNTKKTDYFETAINNIFLFGMHQNCKGFLPKKEIIRL